MDKCKGDEDATAYQNWRRRTFKIRVWNVINIVSLMIGISLFVIFVSVNIPAMAKEQKEQATQPNTSIEKHGRTPAKPEVKIEQPKPTETPSTKK